MYTVENKIGSYGIRSGKHLCEVELKSPCEDIDVTSLCDKILEINPVSDMDLDIDNNNKISVLFKSDFYDLTGDKSSVMFESIFSYFDEYNRSVEEGTPKILLSKVMIRDIGKRPITHNFHYTMKKNVIGAVFHGDIVICPKSFVEDYVDRIDLIQHYFGLGQIVFVIDDVKNFISDVVNLRQKFFSHKERFRYDFWFVPCEDMSIDDKEVLRRMCLEKRLNFGYSL